jgi:hypothetical protein
MTDRWKKDDPDRAELEETHLQGLGAVLAGRPELVDFEVEIHKAQIVIRQQGQKHPATIDFRYSRRTAWSPSACKGIRLASDGSYHWNVVQLTRNYGYDFTKGVLPSIDKLVAAVTEHLNHLGALTTQQKTREQGSQQYADELVAVLQAAGYDVVRRGDRHDITLEVAGLYFSVTPTYATTDRGRPGRTGLTVTTHNIVAVLQAWKTVKAAMAEKG